jgi:hypothetical protein
MIYDLFGILFVVSPAIIQRIDFWKRENNEISAVED